MKITPTLISISPPYKLLAGGVLLLFSNYFVLCGGMFGVEAPGLNLMVHPNHKFVS